MATRSSLWQGFVTVVGFVCLVLTFLLLAPGIRAVRAEGGNESMVYIEPTPEAPELNPAEHTPEAKAPEIDAKKVGITGPPGPADIDFEPGVIVLNTRGFNYGPPPGDVDPAAQRVEAEMP